jgi:NAD(P)-dependent dehydrogenase (short-subunit alcohol dehydrogenase family)
MKDLTEKTAVITGGASGIGLALAKRLSQEGTRLVLADVDQKALDAAVEDLRAEGATVLGVRTDVSDEESVLALAMQARDAFGPVHLLFNNAGVGPGGISWEVPNNVWNWVLDVNLWGVIHGIRAFVPDMISQGEGHVINTSSVAGLRGSPGMGAYAASKHAVIGLSQSLHLDLELAQSDVKVSVLCPGFTQTNMNSSGRNWSQERYGQAPDSGLDPSHPLTRDNFLARMGQGAMTAADVAELTVEAIKRDRFWVLPDPSFESSIPEALKR